MGAMKLFNRLCGLLAGVAYAMAYFGGIKGWPLVCLLVAAGVIFTLPQVFDPPSAPR